MRSQEEIEQRIIKIDILIQYHRKKPKLVKRYKREREALEWTLGRIEVFD